MHQGSNSVDKRFKFMFHSRNARTKCADCNSSHSQSRSVLSYNDGKSISDDLHVENEIFRFKIITENINSDNSLFCYFRVEIFKGIQHGWDNCWVILANIHWEILSKVCQSLNSWPTDFWSWMVESFHHKVIHNRVSKISSDLLVASFRQRSHDQKTAVHLISVSTVDELCNSF